MSDARKSTITYRSDFNRPGSDLAAPASRAAQPEPAQQEQEEGSKLIVGRNIQLKGEITACDTLVVEGRVEASMNSRIIEIADVGLFSGNAEVERAGIHGRFEGMLTVSGRLSIHSTGKVTGTIRYGEIVIEPGGEISGDVQLISRAAPASAERTEKTAAAAPARETPPSSQKSLNWPQNGKGAPASPTAKS
jgi:cytoskeletal protein CcmA (bactofilin family)